VKNVTHTVQSYEAMGVAAIFLEDQVSPKRCGHMSGKRVIQPEVMEERISAAAAARHSEDFFLIARTDAREPEGLDSALRRAERYAKAGADGVYVEAPKSVRELEQIGKALPGVPQMTNMFEGDKETPWVTPKELGKLGFSMILYPTTLLFSGCALSGAGAGGPRSRQADATKRGRGHDRIRRHCRTGALGRDRESVPAWERAVKHRFTATCRGTFTADSLVLIECHYVIRSALNLQRVLI
jgi:2-methylisocitrate lyase-like PEP mutase family enzyme